MIITLSDPIPAPPQMVTLTMTKKEAGQLMAICDAASIEAVTKVGNNCFVTQTVANVASDFWQTFFRAKIEEKI